MERFFKGFDKIREINLKQGYGFVEFEDAIDVDDAVYEINNQSLCGRRTTVERAKGILRSRNFYNDKGVTDTGAAEAFMLAKEEATAVMTTSVSMT